MLIFGTNNVIFIDLSQNTNFRDIMPIYVGFDSESLRIILEAIDFVVKKMKEFYEVKKSRVDESHHDLIEWEYAEKKQQLDQIKSFLTEWGRMGVRYIREESYDKIMDVVRSALEVYLQDTLRAKTETNLPVFDKKIQEIYRIINLDALKYRKNDLFNEYYELPPKSSEGKKLKVFFSYATEDKVLAGKIAKALSERGIDVFLAHEDIEVSEEWREKILTHLKNSDVLIALLTPNYRESVWANQELGYALGKGRKIIPLFVEEVDIRDFGFAETFQGIKVNEENLEDCINKIISVITKL